MAEDETQQNMTPAEPPAPTMPPESAQATDAVGAEVIRGGVPVEEAGVVPDPTAMAADPNTETPPWVPAPDQPSLDNPVRSGLPLGIDYSTPEPVIMVAEPLAQGCAIAEFDVLLRAGSRISRAEWRNSERWMTLARVNGKMVYAVSVVDSLKWGLPTPEDLAAEDWILVG